MWIDYQNQLPQICVDKDKLEVEKLIKCIVPYTSFNNIKPLRLGHSKNNKKRATKIVLLLNRKNIV